MRLPGLLRRRRGRGYVQAVKYKPGPVPTPRDRIAKPRTPKRACWTHHDELGRDAKGHQSRDAVFTLRCEPSTLRRLRDKAKEKGISANAFVRLALVHALTFDIVQVGTRR